MKTHSISVSMSRTLHNAIQTWQPATEAILKYNVSNWLSHQSVHHCKLDVSIKKVYYFGCLQGVKLVLIDKKHRTRKQITPKGKVYSIFN
jgi:L-arabinose isomerase